jgi:hypothetical protein
MAQGVLGSLGPLVGAMIGFLGAIAVQRFKSKDTSKDILTRTVTNERATWRSDLRDLAGDLVENALRIIEGAERGCIYTLERQRLLIRLRLNPYPFHKLDANIMRCADDITRCARSKDVDSAKSAIAEFEKGVQQLLKQEWEKSKREAATGRVG